MKKLVLISVVVLVVMIIGSIFMIPHFRLASLEKALNSDIDTKTKAAIARQILESSGSQGIAAMHRYADRHDLCAFDATHNLLVLCDEDSGSIHEVYVGPADCTAFSTGDKSLDEAATAAIPKVTGISLLIGDPPKRFEGIHLLSAEEDQVDFILKQRAGDEWYRLSFKFAEGRLSSTGSHDVKGTELAQWRAKASWPEAWK